MHSVKVNRLMHESRKCILYDDHGTDPISVSESHFRKFSKILLLEIGDHTDLVDQFLLNSSHPGLNMGYPLHLVSLTFKKFIILKFFFMKIYRK